MGAGEAKVERDKKESYACTRAGSVVYAVLVYGRREYVR